MKNRFFSLIALLLMLLTVSAFSQSVPQTMNFQGHLTNPDGTAIPDTNTQTLTFRLYNAPTSGSKLWEQTFNNIKVHNGNVVVPLDFSQNYQNGSTRMSVFANPLFTPVLEIQVGSDAPLTPRQVFASVAYSLYAGTALSALSVPDGSLTSSSFAPNALGSLAWLLGGNAGTNSTTFLGTTGNQPLIFKVGDPNNIPHQAMRYSYAANSTYGSINVQGGSEINSIAAGVVSATIAGGGLASYNPNAGSSPNKVTADYGTVGGGIGNAAGYAATIGGGGFNTAIGSYVTVEGGIFNTASNFYSTVAGGENNSATGSGATVAGGDYNTADSDDSTIGGGYGNNANGGSSTIGGGDDNTAHGNDSTVGGGVSNYATGDLSTIGGGYYNTANGFASTIAGGGYNTASGQYSFVSGGSNIAAGSYSFAAGHLAQANHNSSFVFSDGANGVFTSTNTNQFLINAQNGVGINTNTIPAGLALNVNGKAQMTGFTLTGNGASANAVLTSDVNGNGTWVSSASLFGTPTNATTYDVWGLNGNSGTTAANFLGTTDNQPLILKAYGQQTMRYAYLVDNTNTYHSINVLGGSGVNSIAAGVTGATIAGGGQDNLTGTDYPNMVATDFGTVGGGAGNNATGYSATIAGGYSNKTTFNYATIGGGYQNTASNYEATSQAAMSILPAASLPLLEVDYKTPPAMTMPL